MIVLLTGAAGASRRHSAFDSAGELEVLDLPVAQLLAALAFGLVAEFEFSCPHHAFRSCAEETSSYRCRSGGGPVVTSAAAMPRRRPQLCVAHAIVEADPVHVRSAAPGVPVAHVDAPQSRPRRRDILPRVRHRHLLPPLA